MAPDSHPRQPHHHHNIFTLPHDFNTIWRYNKASFSDVLFHAASETGNGSFDGVRGVMTLPRNPTNLNVQHELSHMLDFRKYGDDYYKLFTPAQREQMVLERLKNNRIWDKLNDAERDWSLKYPSTRR